MSDRQLNGNTSKNLLFRSGWPPSSLVPVVIDDFCMTHHEFAIFASSDLGLPDDFRLVSRISAYDFSVYCQSTHVSGGLNVHVLSYCTERLGAVAPVDTMFFPSIDCIHKPRCIGKIGEKLVQASLANLTSLILEFAKGAWQRR